MLKRDGTDISSSFINTEIKQKQDHIELFNLRKDPAEKINVADKYPEIVSQISEFAEKEKMHWVNGLIRVKKLERPSILKIQKS